MSAESGGLQPAASDPTTASTDETARLRPKGKDRNPLRGLLPFVMRYRGMVLAALTALLASTSVMLFVPLSIRTLIDQGFSPENAASTIPR